MALQCAFRMFGTTIVFGINKNNHFNRVSAQQNWLESEKNKKNISMSEKCFTFDQLVKLNC